MKAEEARRSYNRQKKTRRTIRNQAVHLHDEMKNANSVHADPPFAVVEIDFRQNANDQLPTEHNNKEKFWAHATSAQRTSYRQILSWLVRLLARVPSNNRGRILRAPGSLLGTISEFVFSKKTLEHIINPMLADLQMEYCEALAAGRPYKAAWVRVRGYWCFAKAIGLYGIIRTAYELWRKVST